MLTSFFVGPAKREVLLARLTSWNLREVPFVPVSCVLVWQDPKKSKKKQNRCI